jgi:hypothetical protein
MFTLAIGHYKLSLSYGELPTPYSHFKEHAQLVDEIDIDGSTSATRDALCCVTVARGTEWPSIVVAQRFSPSAGGFYPGVALVEETSRLFLGAGTRLLCYDLNRVCRVWEDSTDPGFWSWTRHDDVIVMSAELELAAWNLHGEKLWTTFVEPPWDYAVHTDDVHLDVMGLKSVFPLRTGPRNERRRR